MYMQSRCRLWLLLALFACPETCNAEVLFKADFETGDLSEWKDTGISGQNDNSDNIQVVTDVVHSGKFSGKFTIDENDVFNRSQLRVQVGGPKVEVEDGSSTYMSFWLYTAEPPKTRDNFFYWEGQPPPRWRNVMTWWLEPNTDGSTAIKYGTGNLGRDGLHWDAKFEVGQWHQLAMHIRWSEDPDEGQVKLWFDGKVVLDKKLKTKGPEAIYFCQPGIHRSPHNAAVDTIYFDDFILADDLKDIAITKP